MLAVFVSRIVERDYMATRLPHCPSPIRHYFKVRDVTKQNVLKQLGHTEDVLKLCNLFALWAGCFGTSCRT